MKRIQLARTCFEGEWDNVWCVVRLAVTNHIRLSVSISPVGLSPFYRVKPAEGESETNEKGCNDKELSRFHVTVILPFSSFHFYRSRSTFKGKSYKL